EHLTHIFDRFYRVDTGRARARGGSGLGLAICQSIARAHDGEITATSVLGTGSAFTLRLPM
ncbi:MAG TPA: ATP-binding protein, partial [Thermomicrobiales bacterium]|nr:ATP-binding protein [Thermomicrobiales bacterium]